MAKLLVKSASSMYVAQVALSHIFVSKHFGYDLPLELIS
jgi:hypothetical protein